MAGTRYVYPNEAEMYIESLTASDIRNIGSLKWLHQHELVYKLSLQASLSARSEEEEFVKDYFVSSGKISVIVHEIILIEIWKEKVFSEIVASNFQPPSTVPLYLVLYHETLLASLLVAVLFHEDAVESASDWMIDIIDYCHRQLVLLCQSQREADNGSFNDSLSELLQKKEALDFFVGMEAISLLSHIVQHVKILPLCVLHRLINIHDFPMVLVNLSLCAPWKKLSENGEQIYVDGTWKNVDKSNVHKLNKAEGQVWISLIQILLDDDCLKKYEITNFRKNQLLKLRPKVTEVLISQIPFLEEMLRFLENLSFLEPPPYKQDIVIEQLPQIRRALLEDNKNLFSSIAKIQMDSFFSLGKSELRHFYQSSSAIYDLDSLEALLPDKSLCAFCHAEGNKKCSRCRNEWYCGRKCQVSHWSKHKPICDLSVVEK